MQNVITAASQITSYFSNKNLNSMTWMDPTTRAAMLKKYGLQSALSQVLPLVPQNVLNGFQPNTWAQAFRNPPVPLFQRLAWAASTLDATQAELLEHAPKKSVKKKMGNAIDDELAAGELDANYNSPAAIEAQKLEEEGQEGNIVEDVLESMEQTKARAIADIAHAYEESDAAIQDELGIADRPPMTDEEVAKWKLEHEGEPEHLGIRGFLLDQIAEHSEHFNLGQAQVADRFLDHTTAMLMKAGKGQADLQGLSPNAIGAAFDKHVQSLTNAVNVLEQAGVNAVKQQVPTLAPAPMSVPMQMNQQLAQMQAPGVAAAPNTVQRLDQLRLAAIKLMYPNLPQPANALNQKIAPNPSQSSHESIKQELEHYAKEIGVGLSTMGKAADRFILQHIWPSSNPNHTATQQLMQQNPLVALVTKPKSIMQKMMADAMKPQQHPG